MADPVVHYPYETRLNLLHQPLEVIDVQALADTCEYTMTRMSSSMSWKGGCLSIWKTASSISLHCRALLYPKEFCIVPAHHKGL
jgi:hypothetical protein